MSSPVKADQKTVTITLTEEELMALEAGETPSPSLANKLLQARIDLRKGRASKTSAFKHCPHCGVELVARSSPDHRRLFAIIAEAFKQWPEQYEYFQPDTPEHLRAWMLCKLHHSTATEIPVPDGVDPKMLATMMPAIMGITTAIMRECKTHAFVRTNGGKIAVYKPKSLSFGEVDQKYFNGLRDGVEGIVQLVIGVTGEQLLEQSGTWVEVPKEERTRV